MIFHSYVKLPEGTWYNSDIVFFSHKQISFNFPQCWCHRQTHAVQAHFFTSSGISRIEIWKSMLTPHQDQRTLSHMFCFVLFNVNLRQMLRHDQCFYVLRIHKYPECKCLLQKSWYVSLPACFFRWSLHYHVLSTCISMNEIPVGSLVSWHPSILACIQTRMNWNA